MPTLSTIALYLGTSFLALIIPGPAVMYIIAQGVRQGRRAGLTAVLGGSTGVLVQVTACAAGLSWLLLSSSLAFSVVKYVGAAYLIYLGLSRLFGRAESLVEPRAEIRSPARLYGEGVLVNILNPKLALFFLAFLPQFLDPARGSITLQIAVLGGLFAVLGICTDSSYALLAGTVGPWLRGSPRFRKGERLVVGTTFIGLGITAALTPAARQSH